MDVIEEYLKIEKLDPTQVPDAAIKHKEESFAKMTNEFSAVESSGKQFIKEASDVRTSTSFTPPPSPHTHTAASKQVYSPRTIL